MFRNWIELELLAEIAEKSVDFKVVVVQTCFAYQDSSNAGYVDSLGVWGPLLQVSLE